MRRAGGESHEDEDGSTLIEVLVASVIMASTVIMLVTGMGVLFTSSIQNRQLTTTSVVARDYAEALDLAVAQASAQSGPWCSTSYTVPWTPPTGFTVTPSFGACPATDAATPQFQTVTISASAPSGAVELLRMVVRQS